MARDVGIPNFLVQTELWRENIPSLDVYPFNLPAVRTLDKLQFHPKVTFLVGDNGTGKSTLMEAIAVALGMNAEGGSKGFNFSTRETHSNLHEYLKIFRGPHRPHDMYFLRAESFYNVASEIEKLDGDSRESPHNPPISRAYGGKSLHEQSHGESFLALFQNRFRGSGVYLLDEPEAALSPMRQLAFLASMHDLLKVDSQFIIATHSPIIMAYPHSWIYSFTEKGIARTEYKETEHYKVTRNFLSRTDQMLSVLLEEEPALFDEPKN